MNRMRPLTSSLLIAVLAAPAGAQAPAPNAPPKQAPPAAGPARAFTVPAAKSFRLDNGLTVTFVPWGDVPKVRYELVIRAGNVFEKADEVWLADVVGQLVAEGTTTRNATALAEAAAAMGGTYNVAVGPDDTEIVGEALSESATPMAELVAELAKSPALPEAELPRVKADLSRNLAISRQQPQQLAQERFRTLLYGDHPYGRILPKDGAVEAYTLAQVRAFHAAHYGPARAALYVSGRFDAAAVEAAVRKAFGDWKGGGAAVAPKASPKGGRTIDVLDRPGAVQSTILMGLPVVPPSHPDYVPLLVTHTLLGGYFGSRITANIREQKGYTYSPNAQLSTRRGDAYWVEQADVTTAVTAASLKEIFYEIDKLQSEPPSEQELAGVRNYIAGTFVLQNSSRAGLLGQLQFLEAQGLSESYLKEFVAKVQAVTPAQVSEMAKKHLRDEDMAIVIVGDKKLVDEQLAPGKK